MEDGQQGARILLQLRHQRKQRDPLRWTRWWAALQARQRQQVADQRLHAGRLLRHQRQIAFTLRLFERTSLQGLDKAGQHRQRCANFVRNVGNEIATHGLGLLHGSDITREQEQAPLAIGMQMNRQFDRPCRRIVPPRHDDFVHIVATCKIADKAGITHQIANVLQHVARCVQTKVKRSHMIEPLNAALRVQQHDAIGRSLESRQKILQPLLCFRCGLIPYANQPTYPI